MRKYRFAFDLWGLLLFLLIMLPNFIWAAVPAPNDILRGESYTPIIDSIGSVCQVLMAAALCLLVNRERGPLGPTRLILTAGGCVLLYYAGWVCYYLAFAGPPVILLLTLPPCLAFGFFAYDRKNAVAMLPIAVFTIYHLIYAAANFIL